MRGVQKRSDLRVIARSVAAVAQGHRFAQAGKEDQSEFCNVWSSPTSAVDVQEELHPEKLQEVLWRQFFADTAKWWDNRQNKRSPRHPDFRHKESKVPLWVDNRHKPTWVGSQLATMDAGLTTSAAGPGTAQGSGAFAETQEHLEFTMCRKLCEDGEISEAVDALDVLVKRGCHVPRSLLYRMLKRCTQDKNLALGRRIHVLTVKSGYDGDTFLATHLIGLYASHGRLEEARGVFTKVCTPDAYNWATIIFAYARHGETAEAAEAIRLYRQMSESTSVKHDDRLYLAVLTACAAANDLSAGKEVHARVTANSGTPNRFVQAGLVNMYAKCGCLDDARRLFDILVDKNVVTWTAMIAGYAQQGLGHEALSLYSSMQQEGLTANSVTYVCLLQACASIGVGALLDGKQLHAQVEERALQRDAVVGGSLVNMYAKCGSLKDARKVFDNLPNRSVIAWTAMIAGCVQQGLSQEALSLHSRMQQEGLTPPNPVTYVCLLQACASVGVVALDQGKKLHSLVQEQGLEEDSVVGGSLVNMYAKCGCLQDARGLFDRLADKNVVAWNAMIAGYSQQGMSEELLSLYSSMQQEGPAPDSVTYVCLLQAIAAAAVLPLGQQLHAEIVHRGVPLNGNVGAALVNMYAKCGSIVDSQRVFDSLPGRSVEAWGALIGGYARQGDSVAVFDLVARMRLEGVQPNDVMFLSVLTVCSHVGLVDKGREYFEAMRADDSISPSLEHYICMVDLLGRAGHLQEALDMVKSMPFPPNDVVWQALLSACQKWKNVEIGRQAFEGAVGLDKGDASAYLLMSNIYASTQMWGAAKEMKGRRKKAGAWKVPGQSRWTDMAGVVHTFVAGDDKYREVNLPVAGWNSSF